MTDSRNPSSGDPGAGGPRPSTVPPGLDVGPVTAWLADALPAATPPFAFARIGDGRSNLTFRVDDAAGASWILRRPPLGERLRGAHDMDREFRILRALSPSAVAVPEPLGLCADEAVTGAPFYVMELVPGRVLSTVADVEAYDEDRRRVVARSLVEALAELHRFGVEGTALEALGPWHGYAERQLRAWWRQWQASRTSDVPAVERIRDALAASVPPQRRTALVHGDYRLDNVVVSEGGQVAAILDWELCTIGDPVADLGTLMTYWVQAGDPVEWSVDGERAPTRAAGLPTRTELAETYAELVEEPVTSLRFYEALGCWRLAIIAQGVARRYEETPENANLDTAVVRRLRDAMLGRAEGLIARP